MLYLTEQDVREFVTITDAISVTERAFRHLGSSRAENMPRRRLRTDNCMLHLLAGADQEEGQLGWKIYTTTRQGAKFLVGIYDEQQGELVALIEADYLGQLRTGAASAVATRYLASPNCQRLGVIGCGLQARMQAWAVAAVLPLSQIQVYSRTEQSRRDFADQLSAELNLPVAAVTSASQLVRESTVIVTATTSKTPVFSGHDLPADFHINAVGSNFLKKTELDRETFLRTERIVCDSLLQCQQEAGDFVLPVAEGLISWSNIEELSQVIRIHDTQTPDKRQKRNQRTLFKSVGMGIQDVALGHLVWERARQ